MRTIPQLLVLLLFLAFAATAPAAEELWPGVQRIVFLGDSITYGGQYVDSFEAYLAVRFPDRKFEVINVGLPSETVSGLSEEGHADGKFPRPDLHERLDRVLAKTRPDLVFACYGMNDGIYLPLAAERFARFRSGIERLREKVAATGAQIIHLTPPTFDPEPIRERTSLSGADGKMFAGYDDVLERYAAWLLEQRAKGWRVIDVHGAMKAALAEGRAANPAFRFAGDGVHCDAAGHWIFTHEILRALGQPTDDFTRDPAYAGLLELIRERGRMLTDAWLSEIGHQRPGMNSGLSLEVAREKAARLDAPIRERAAAIAGAR